MTRATIPVMGLVSGATLATSILGSSAGKAKVGDTPAAHVLKGNWESALVKTQYNLSQGGTYTPVLIPLAIWFVGRAFLGKVRLTRRISMF